MATDGNENGPLGPDEAMNRVLTLRGRSVAFAYALLRDFHGAEDAFQEAAVVVVRRLDEFRGGSFDAWFWTILRNVLGNRLRAAKRAPLVADAAFLDRMGARFAEDPDPSPEENVDLLVACIEKLTGKARQVIRWRFLDNLAVPEISKKLGRTVSATYSVIKRARRAVRECVELKAGSQGAEP